MDYLKSWGGIGRVSYTHHAEPVTVTVSSPDKPEGPEQEISLVDLVSSVTPPCRLNPLLFNGHLQTCWTAVREAVDVPVHYKRWIFDADLAQVAGEFAVDFVVPPYEQLQPTKTDRDNGLPPRTSYFTDDEFAALGRTSPASQGHHDGVETTGAEALADDDDRPMLICLHGLTGGSYEPYLRAVLEPLVEAGWAACVVNSRGCAGSKITTGILYNARATWDCRQIVKWCRKTWPKRKLYGIGFSLGASMMANYLGEEGDNCLLEAGVVVCNPWTLEVGSLGLQRTFIGKELYSKTMGSNLKRLFSRHADMMKTNPRMDLEKVATVKYLHEFDRVVQGPCWGYPTEGAYYRDATSTDAMCAIRVPMLGINAEDDPIALREAIPYEEFKQNPYTVLLTSSLGGHLGSFEVGGKRWFAKPAANFLMKIASDVKKINKPDLKPLVEDANLPIFKRQACFAPSRHKLGMAGIN